MNRPFVDPNDRFSYEDWMNDMATRDDDCARRTVKRWRGRVFVYRAALSANEVSRG